MTTKSWIRFRYENPLKKRLQDGFFESLPTTSGVYFMLDDTDSILYVGKAKNLRKRLLTYKNAKPGQVPEHTIEMLDQVLRIEWEEHPSESRALTREFDLIRELKPPYNIAGTWPNLDSYIAIKFEPEKLHIQLSSRDDFAEGFESFGVFRHRARTKKGYSALLRMLYAISANNPRFYFPARISSISPAYRYSVKFDQQKLKRKLIRFLQGESDALLRTFVEGLLANEHIPEFMHAGLQDDLRRLREFYEVIRGIPVPDFSLKNRS